MPIGAAAVFTEGEVPVDFEIHWHVAFIHGVKRDVLDYHAAVTIDRDSTPESRTYLEGLAGSRYFTERPPLADHADLDRRLRNGDITLALEIPPNFGKDLLRGRQPEIAAWIDGAMPFRAETVRGYLEGVHLRYLSDLAFETYGEALPAVPAGLEPRYRYNQDFKSVYTMVPSNIAIMLVFIPAILMALGVVREKELGQITNLYVTPVTRLEFLLGKQMPYVALGMCSYLVMVALSVFAFGVPLKGSFWALSLAALLYVIATTGLGLLISSFTRTQAAALFATAIGTSLPAVQFSGLMQPVSSLEGGAAIVGQAYPTTHFMTVSVGTFTKALGFGDLTVSFLALAAFPPILTLASLALLKAQER